MEFVYSTSHFSDGRQCVHWHDIAAVSVGRHAWGVAVTASSKSGWDNVVYLTTEQAEQLRDALNLALNPQPKEV